MTRKWIGAVVLMVCGLLVAGCNQPSSTTNTSSEKANKETGKITDAIKDVKDAAKDKGSRLKEAAKEGADAAKTKVIKPIEEALPKIEDKIKGLNGEAATKAKEKFEALKKHLEEFKSAAPDKWESLKEEIVKEFDELKKMIPSDK